MSHRDQQLRIVSHVVLPAQWHLFGYVDGISDGFGVYFSYPILSVLLLCHAVTKVFD